MYEEDSIFDTFNARHLTAQQIAETFVPPVGIFSELMSVGNHLLTGPRGSGKTTLLRMLTVPALLSWQHIEAEQFLNRIDFVGVFVPADRNWHGQLKSLSKYELDQISARTLGEAAFTTHILKGLVRAFQDINEAVIGQHPYSIHKQLVKLDQNNERDLVREVAKGWRLDVAIPTFAGLQSALSLRLIDIGLLRRSLMKMQNVDIRAERNDYLYLDHRECVRFAVELCNSMARLPSRRFCLMFDELEIAPSSIQQALLADLRGGAEESICIYKLALAPFNKHFYKEFNEVQPTARNDYVHIDLTYARKELGYDFSTQLIRSLLHRNGLQNDDARTLLGPSGFDFWDSDATVSPYANGGNVTRSLRSLHGKDHSFREYLDANHLTIEGIGDQRQESERAQYIRKVRSIAMVRDYFIRAPRELREHEAVRDSQTLSAEPLTSRSRKSYFPFTGFPSMLALAEGNPRWLLGLFRPLIRELAVIRQASAKGRVDRATQAREIQEAIKAFRSLLRTIPYKNDERGERGLLKFLDTIGTFFYNGSVMGPFKAQPPLSFTVDANVDEEVIVAVGRALNVGALVYVPDHESDKMLANIRGKRFRLCYLLSAYYKLPIILNTAVSLGVILDRSGKGQGGGKHEAQPSLPLE